MLLITAAIATVALVSGRFHTHSVSKETKYCCSPPQWETFQWGIGGAETPRQQERLGVSVWTTAFLSFDRDRQRFYYYKNATIGPHVSSRKVIEDLESGYKYTLDLKTNTCKKTNIIEVLNNGCVSENAVHLSRVYYGIGNDSLYANVYKFNIQSSTVSLEDYIMVSDQDCILVSESIRGKINGVAVALTLNYLQTKSGIRDPSVFNIPGVCKQNATTGDPVSERHTMYGFP